MLKQYIIVDKYNKIIGKSSSPNELTITTFSTTPIDLENFSKIYRYNAESDTIKIEDNTSYITKRQKRKTKMAREIAVNNITVTTSSGKVFDGDEKSQDRMVRAIQVADITSQTETTWRLADNNDVTVSLEELKEALSLAGQEMSRIWLAD